MAKKLDMVIPPNLVDEVAKEVIDTSLNDISERKYPFTRFQMPNGIDVARNIGKGHNCDIYCCNSLEAARELRTELIKSLELLNYYIAQVEETGEIRYVR